MSQSSLANAHYPTLVFNESGNHFMIKSIVILLFLFNSFLDAVFEGFFVAMYPVPIDHQIAHSCAYRNFFILFLHISYFKPFWPLNYGTSILYILVLSMIYLRVVKLLLEGPSMIPIVGILRGGSESIWTQLVLLITI